MKVWEISCVRLLAEELFLKRVDQTGNRRTTGWAILFQTSRKQTKTKKKMKSLKLKEIQSNSKCLSLNLRSSMWVYNENKKTNIILSTVNSVAFCSAKKSVTALTAGTELTLVATELTVGWNSHLHVFLDKNTKFLYLKYNTNKKANRKIWVLIFRKSLESMK